MHLSSRPESRPGLRDGNRSESFMRGGLVLHSIRTFLAIFIMFVVLPGAGPSLAASPAADELVALAKSAGKPVIADFGLGFCMQCKKQAEILERVRNAYGEKLIVRMVNAVKEQGLMSRYGVEMVPTLVFFDAAGNVVLKKVGPMGYDAIRDQLSRMGVE
jgi:thiol-disulfide isomerase/thioredoxin